EVLNAGAAPARGLQVTNTLAPHLLHANSLPAPSNRQENPLEWELGTLPPGQVARIRCDLIGDEIGLLTGEIEARAANARDPARATLQVTVKEPPPKGEPKLVVQVKGPQQRMLGRPALFTLTVSNPGTSRASNVRLFTSLPKEVEVSTAPPGQK